MLSTTVVKILVLSGMFILTFICTLIPLRFAKMIERAHQQHNSVHTRRYKGVFSLLSCFAAGVFLATCLLDLFPEAKEKLENALDRSGIITSYPMAEFVLTCGLFMILAVEQMVLVMKRPEKAVIHKSILSAAEQNTRSSHQSAINGTDYNNSFSNNIYEDDEHRGLLSGHRQHHTASEEDEEEDHGHHHTDLYLDLSSHSVVRAIILLVALSLHSIFEGLAIGLQATRNDVIQISVALLLHKCLIAFSLGVNLVQSKLSMGTIVKGNLIFSIMSPVGIGIGIAIMDFTADSVTTTLVNGILQSFACGTFLYIVFFEILPHELNSVGHYPNRMLKVLCLIVGYSTVALLLFLNPDIVTTRVPQKANV